ncbi:GAF and ANTAR domain-containing protein [Nocardioides pocheonensis]|uniref:ANTAR domain-containing protein n=1 Tax=Nocardioides pocheonensis TaxID=661485 RepID=A0A3N0GN55_9ACTN|nr:GAF and ANTAR domain-containing protein [Nocardioides pocheonensis]RNM13867.1 ANTAR domain-containing protein [Nocardioides pocheonensis]
MADPDGGLDGGQVGGASRRAVRVAESFVALADTLVDDFDVVELFDRLVSDSVNLLDVDAAAILLSSVNRTLEAVASSDEASRVVELVQLQSHAGPCIDAMRTGEPVHVTDAEEIVRRWPAFGRAVLAAGFTAVYAVPLRLRDERIGALNLYASGDPLTEFDRRLAQALADVATIAILQQRKFTRASVLAEQLQAALNTRISVEQAKGVIAEYGGVDMGVAFDAIRDFARRHRLKLSAVAGSLVERELDPGQVVEPRRDR